MVLNMNKGRAHRINSFHTPRVIILCTGSPPASAAVQVNLAVALGMLSTRTQARLVELNTLRNRCSHNWLLKAPVRRGRRPKQKKTPLLRYRNCDLHRVDVLEEFLAEYGPMYAVLFERYLG